MNKNAIGIINVREREREREERNKKMYLKGLVFSASSFWVCLIIKRMYRYSLDWPN